MRPLLTSSIRRANNLTTITRPISNTFITRPKVLHARQQVATMTSTSSNIPDLKIENTNINTASDIKLSEHQRTIIGSVLDLFAGRPSLAKLQLWKDDAVFKDPINLAEGRKQYETQWYGLQTAFSEIERISHEVKSAGNPIELDMRTRYVIKGLNKEQTIDSKVMVYLDAQGEKITKVEDRWNGELANSSIKDAFRKLNAAVVSKTVSVPKNAEEDKARGN